VHEGCLKSCNLLAGARMRLRTRQQLRQCCHDFFAADATAAAAAGSVGLLRVRTKQLSQHKGPQRLRLAVAPQGPCVCSSFGGVQGSNDPQEVPGGQQVHTPCHQQLHHSRQQLGV
jgi:hypothetical protein